VLRKIIWSSLKFLPRGFYFRMISQGMTMEHRSLAIRSPSFWIRNPTSLGLENIWMLRFNLSGNPLCFWVKSCELLFWSLQLCFGEFSCVNFPEIHRDLFPLKQPRSRLSGIGSASVPRAKRLCISEVFSWWGPACLKMGYPWLGTPFHPALINDDQWQFLAYNSKSNFNQFQTYPTYPVGGERTRTQALRPAISPFCILRQNPLTIFNAYVDDPGN
jgi:hypothetical protein